jgi:hypothetical protein
LRRLEQSAERVANEAVELRGKYPIRVGEAAQMKEEVRPLLETFRVAARLRAGDALEVPEIPLARLRRTRPERDDGRALGHGLRGRKRGVRLGRGRWDG